jgi:hypothetical protein
MENIIEKESYSLTPEGWHDAQIYKTTRIQNHFCNGKGQVQIIFDILDIEDECRVMAWFSPTLNKKSKLSQLLNLINPFCDDFNALDLNILIGKKIKVLVEHQEKRGQLYANPVEYKGHVPEYVFDK